jgi:hypothetical protein
MMKARVFSVSEPRLHDILPSESHTGDTLSATQFTQRAVNRDYRIETGKHVESDCPPELDGSTKASKIPPMMTFDNPYGHFVERVLTDNTGKPVKKENGQDKTETISKVFDIKHHTTAQSFYDYITSKCKTSINRSSKSPKDRFCWDLQGIITVNLRRITSPSSQHGDIYKRYATTQKSNRYNPLSVHTIQACLESENKGNRSDSPYNMISVSTTMTAIPGGINNNLTIEMGFEEKQGTKDLQKRAFDDKYIHIICIGSTPHNADAGKVRRLVSYTRARMLSPRPLWPLENIISQIDNHGDWVVHCMGSTLETSEDGVKSLVLSMQEGLVKYGKSQFDYPNHYYLPAPPTFMVYHKSKVLAISIAPGVVIKQASSGDMGDSSMISHQKTGKLVSSIKSKMDGIRDTHNPYYMFFCYPNENQQPRQAFANSQTVQCQGLPWGPANARISPNYVCNPLIGTKFSRMVEQDHINNEEAIWDVMPGQNVVVCFAALPWNYEDGIVVSQKFADMGGFSNTSIVPVRLRERENIPEVGERLCGKKYKWWKVPCSSSCICYTGQRKDNVISVKREPTGIVHSVKTTKDGGISVHVLSFSQFNSGDKLGSIHGQKGVATIMPYHDLPPIITKHGESMIADVYISPASVISRQTHGIVYESGASWRAARDGKVGLDAMFDLDDIETETCQMIMNPFDGTPIMRVNRETNKPELVKATYGMISLIAQTQTTREKHHLTHNVEGKYALNVVPGRGSGGGVSRSEMDAHVAYANGTTAALEELVLRENTIVDHVCTECFRIMELCGCGTDENWEQTRISSGLKEYDMLSLCINGSANTYVT